MQDTNRGAKHTTNSQNAKSKGYKKIKSENHKIHIAQKIENHKIHTVQKKKIGNHKKHDVTTNERKNKNEEIQKTTPTEDARQGRNDRLGQDLNPGTNGLTAPAALFGSVLYNPNIFFFHYNFFAYQNL